MPNIPYVTEFTHPNAREFHRSHDDAITLFHTGIMPFHTFYTRGGSPAFTIRVVGSWFTHELGVSGTMSSRTYRVTSREE